MNIQNLVKETDHMAKKKVFVSFDFETTKC